MEFKFINLFGFCIVVLILIPNIIYAIKSRGSAARFNNRFLSITENISRYACIFLMIFPVFVWEFGFKSVSYFAIYLIGNSFLIIAYFLFWILYFKKKTLMRAICLAVMPSTIFILSAVTLTHIPLLIFAVTFSVSHIFITYKNAI